MGGGWILLLTVIGGGLVALAAYAVNCYLSGTTSSTTTAETAETTKHRNTEKTEQQIVAPEKDNLSLEEIGTDDVRIKVPSVAAASVYDLVEVLEDTLKAPKVVNMEASKLAPIPTAFSAESVLAE